MSLVDIMRACAEGNGLFKRSLRGVAKIILKSIYGRRGIKIKLGGKCVVRMDIDFAQYESFGDRHNRGWLRCLEYCRGKKIFFDVGVHIGLYSIPASIELGSTGRVFAFDPGTKNYEALNRHIAMNKIDNISTYNCLVGDSNSSILFYEDTETVNPMNSLVLTEKMIKSPHLYKKTYREQITLDDFCRDENVVPDIIKIDVEGAELLVLKGAQTILRKHHPTIFLSLHPSRMEMLGHSVNKLTTFIDDLGYEMRDIDLAIPKELVFGEYLLLPKRSN